MKDEKDHSASLAAVENAEPVASAAAPHVAKHTPGPWKLETVRTSVGVCHKIGPFQTGHDIKPESWACVYEDGMSKQVEHGRGTLDSELLANAHLIAAAPELLALARYVLAHPHAAFGMGDIAHMERVEMQRLAEAAMAKAEGRQ